jgi:hypothetical protein
MIVYSYDTSEDARDAVGRGRQRRKVSKTRAAVGTVSRAVAVV